MPADTATPPLHIVLFGFDWNGFSARDPEEFIRKLQRRQIDADAHVVHQYIWSVADTARWVTPRFEVRSWKTRLRRLRPLLVWRGIRRILDRLDADGVRPDVYLTSSFETLVLGAVLRRRYGTRTVFYAIGHGKNLSLSRRLPHVRRAWTATVERLTWRIPEVYMSLSSSTDAYLRSIGVPDDRIVRYATNTIQRDAKVRAQAVPGRFRSRLGLAPSTPLVVSVGRLQVEKGHARLLALFAAGAPANAHLVLAGEGALREALADQARALGIDSRVHFTGGLDRRDIWDLYLDADAFVLLSKSEALGAAAWEAMVSRVPVIGSEAPGLVESIGEDESRGRILRADADAADFGRALAHCLTPSPEREAMLDRAEAHVLRLLHDSPTFEQIVHERLGLGHPAAPAPPMSSLPTS